MKYFSKTLLSSALLSCLSISAYADILDYGINYCRTNKGGCGIDETFKQIVESVFDTCAKDPNKDGCKIFNDKLVNDYQKKVDLEKDYVKKSEIPSEVSKCLEGGTNFTTDVCADIRNNVIDRIYIPKKMAQSYVIFPPSSKGSDALYLGSINPTNPTNPDTVGTFIKSLDDFNKLNEIKADTGRLSFKWITGLDVQGNPTSKCGVVIGLKLKDTPLNADENSIICKTDLPKIEKCTTEKLTCEQ